MSTAQYRRIIKGSWSNTNEQRRLDQQCEAVTQDQQETDNKTTPQEEQ